MPVFGSQTELLDPGVDAVTITTPPQTRRELVLEALDRRVAVVADKPFAPTAAAGRELFGEARRVTANLDWVDLPDGRTDGGFVLTIDHASGVHSHVSAQSDVQAQAIFGGFRPVDDPRGWGYEAPERWGTLATADGTSQVPSEQGAYSDHRPALRTPVPRGFDD